MNEKAREIREALEAAQEFRGHVLGKHEQVVAGNGQTFFDVECVRCGAGVRVTPEPQPNQQFISGEALAVHCKEDEPEPEELGDYQLIVRDLLNLL